MATTRKKTHLDDSQIEDYCLGKIPEPELEEVEEHLLICESCQQRVAEGDAYAKSMQDASLHFRAQEQKPRTAWAASGLVPVLAVALVVVGVGTFLHSDQGSGGPRVPVALEVTRGAGVLAQAPARRSLLLNPGLDGLPALTVYRLEMVDRNGKRVFQRDFTPGKGVEAPSQTSGIYFVRLYTIPGVLLREYALEIRSGQ
jgi:Putative zinc-finger